MSEDETLYVCRVETSDHRQVLTMQGRRPTLIEAALAVICDNAPGYDPRFPESSNFQLYIAKVKTR